MSAKLKLYEKAMKMLDMHAGYMNKLPHTSDCHWEIGKRKKKPEKCNCWKRYLLDAWEAKDEPEALIIKERDFLLKACKRTSAGLEKLLSDDGVVGQGVTMEVGDYLDDLNNEMWIAMDFCEDPEGKLKSKMERLIENAIWVIDASDKENFEERCEAEKALKESIKALNEKEESEKCNEDTSKKDPATTAGV
jgi:hypothetical protein